MSKPNSKALVTLTNLKPVKTEGDGKTATVAVLDSLIAKANEQYAAIKNGDRATTLRALFLGLLFYQIKNEAVHGTFEKIAAEKLSSIPARTRRDYMKLAITYVEKTKLALPERIEIPDAQIALALDDASSSDREMVTKAVSFIGELSLHELMIKHGIRGVGLKTELTEAAAVTDDLSSLPPEEQVRIRRERLFGSTAEFLGSLRNAFTKPEDLEVLEPIQLETIERELVELRALVVAARKAA